MAQLLAEAYRLRLMGGLEDLLHGFGYGPIAGIDEAGRGALAGPVVAAAVVVGPGRLIPGIDDSKSLTAAERERLAGAIRDTCPGAAVAAVSPQEIDRINVLEATRRAMVQALNDLDPAPELALVDAVRLAAAPCPCFALVRGDQISYAIACASIVAKVARDQMMAELDRHYPQYGFAAHKGYGAQRHREALTTYGPSAVHRLTFRSVLPRGELRPAQTRRVAAGAGPKARCG